MLGRILMKSQSAALTLGLAFLFLATTGTVFSENPQAILQKADPSLAAGADSPSPRTALDERLSRILEKKQNLSSVDAHSLALIAQELADIEREIADDTIDVIDAQGTAASPEADVLTIEEDEPGEPPLAQAPNSPFTMHDLQTYLDVIVKKQWPNLYKSAGSGDNSAYYYLAPPLIGMLEAYEATRDPKYLTGEYGIAKIVDRIIENVPWRGKSMGGIPAYQSTESVARAAYFMQQAGEKTIAQRYARFCQDLIDADHDSRISLSSPWVDRKDFFALTNLFTYKVNGRKDNLVRALKLARSFREKSIHIESNGQADWTTINAFPVATSLARLKGILTSDQWEKIQKPGAAGVTAFQRDRLTPLMTPRRMDVSHANRQPMMVTEFYRLAPHLRTKPVFSRKLIQAMARTFTDRLLEWPKPDAAPFLHSFFDGHDWPFVLDEMNLFNAVPGKYGNPYNGWCQLGAFDAKVQSACEAILSGLMRGERKLGLSNQISFVGRLMRNLKDLGRP